jgi:hypothetical protein
MQRKHRPWLAPALGMLLCALTAFVARAQQGPGADAVSTAPVLINAGFECLQGYAPQSGINGLVPSGWTAVLVNGYPKLNSTRTEFAGSCGGSGFIERLEGEDSLAFLSQDIETPPDPGKPFDALVYQQVVVTPGTAYSVSGWMVSLCGGSAMPNDCPAGYYMTKMLGLDPTGGANPTAASVIWMEDRRNFTESRWANLRLGATAQSDKITIFARIASPYRWHGAHAFVDAVSVMRSPQAYFVDLPPIVRSSQTLVRWAGSLGPDIPAIPGGNYQLRFDVQVRPAGATPWTDWQPDRPAGEALFTVDACTAKQTVEFRVRARAEQPEGVPGAWPNHRYPGDWGAPQAVVFVNDGPCQPAAFFPLVLR